jgi:hypothetical protein
MRLPSEQHVQQEQDGQKQEQPGELPKWIEGH